MDAHHHNLHHKGFYTVLDELRGFMSIACISVLTGFQRGVSETLVSWPA